MVMGCAAYEGGKRVADLDFDHLEEFKCKTGGFIWIGLHEPTQEALQRVQQRFGLHDLAIEDAHRAHQRPKVEVYGDSLFVVLRTAQLVDKRIQFGETHVFVGKDYVVSIRHGSSASYREVRTRCESTPRLLKLGTDFVLYAIMDFVVDNYFPVVDALEEEVESLEEHVFNDDFDQETVEHIYRLKRDLLSLRRAVAPVVEMSNRLTRFDMPLIDKHAYPYFRDIHDHAVLVNDSVDYLRELLNSALEVDLLLASVGQSEVTKKLASWAAILAVPTAVAGIYGMNFAFMPELHWTFGYPVVMAAILGACGLLYWRFKKTHWL